MPVFDQIVDKNWTIWYLRVWIDWSTQSRHLPSDIPDLHEKQFIRLFLCNFPAILQINLISVRVNKLDKEGDSHYSEIELGLIQLLINRLINFEYLLPWPCVFLMVSAWCKTANMASIALHKNSPLVVWTVVESFSVPDLPNSFPWKMVDLWLLLLQQCHILVFLMGFWS